MIIEQLKLPCGSIIEFEPMINGARNAFVRLACGSRRDELTDTEWGQLCESLRPPAVQPCPVAGMPTVRVIDADSVCVADYFPNI